MHCVVQSQIGSLEGASSARPQLKLEHGMRTGEAWKQLTGKLAFIPHTQEQYTPARQVVDVGLWGRRPNVR